MAMEDEVNHENSLNFIFDELIETFNDLMDEFKKLRLKIKSLKGQIFFWIMKSVNY